MNEKQQIEQASAEGFLVLFNQSSGRVHAFITIKRQEITPAKSLVNTIYRLNFRSSQMRLITARKVQFNSQPEF